MYEEHEAFLPPENEDVQVWRYMDFTKFISLLDTKSLHFCRADRLGDPFEGSLTEANVKARDKLLEELWAGKIRDEVLAEQIKKEPNFNHKVRESMFINCWHMNEHESAAMWKLYLKSDEGIAIQSTYKKLKESFANNSEDIVRIGRVEYIDYSSEAIPRDNLFRTVLHKRKSFEHERELRVLFWDLDVMRHIYGPERICHNGRYVKSDLEILIQRIYIAPNTPNWLEELVRSLVRKYDVLADVKESRLDAEALF